MLPKLYFYLRAEKWEFSLKHPVLILTDSQAFHFGPSTVVELETAVRRNLVATYVCRGTELTTQEFFFVYFITYVIDSLLDKNDLITLNHLPSNKFSRLKLPCVHVAQQSYDKFAVVHIIKGVEWVWQLFFA